MINDIILTIIFEKLDTQTLFKINKSCRNFYYLTINDCYKRIHSALIIQSNWKKYKFKKYKSITIYAVSMNYLHIMFGMSELCYAE